jgi:hypothetical protein
LGKHGIVNPGIVEIEVGIGYWVLGIGGGIIANFVKHGHQGSVEFFVIVCCQDLVYGCIQQSVPLKFAFMLAEILEVSPGFAKAVEAAVGIIGYLGNRLIMNNNEQKKDAE